MNRHGWNIALETRKRGRKMARNERTKLSKNYQAASKLLTDKEYLFNAMMGAIGDLVTIQDIDMRIIYQNEALKKVMGDHKGEFCYEVYEKKDKICEGCPVRLAYEDGEIHRALRVGVLPDGTRRRYENIASVLRDKQGKIVAGIEIIRDVEEKEEAKEELQKSEERYRSYIELTGQLAWVANARGEVEEDLPSWRKFTGQTSEEVRGFGWSKALHPDDVEHTIRLWNKAVETKTGCSTEYRVRKYDGTYRFFLSRGVPVITPDGSIREWVGTCVDITDRRKFEEEKEKLKFRLFQSEKMSAVGQLAAGVAHEINNPLGIILGFAQSAVKGIKESDPLALPLKSIEREAVRCKNLVQNLLIFSRTSKNENLEEMDLNAGVEGCLSLIIAQAKMYDVELVKELCAGFPRIRANKNQIQQVIINLASNALDAMPKGGMLAVKTSLSDKQPGHVEIQVQDTGTGIPKEIREKIFEPFFTTKEVGKGTGLGLSLVYEIVRRHGGTIKLTTKEGEGSIFTICLPVTGRGKNSHD